MTIEEKLKQYILDRYNSLREFTIKIDMSYSTFDSILKRGIQNATISNVLKICNELNISADELATGHIVPITSRKPAAPIEIECEDVSDILANTKRRLLAYQGLMFNGQPADEESIKSILDAMEIGMEMAKRKKK